MCHVILHFGRKTGCMCSLNEHGEFIIALVLSACTANEGDLLVGDSSCAGMGELFNATQDVMLKVDILYRTRSEVYARTLLRNLLANH